MSQCSRTKEFTRDQGLTRHRKETWVGPESSLIVGRETSRSGEKFGHDLWEAQNIQTEIFQGFLHPCQLAFGTALPFPATPSPSKPFFFWLFLTPDLALSAVSSHISPGFFESVPLTPLTSSDINWCITPFRLSFFVVAAQFLANVQYRGQGVDSRGQGNGGVFVFLNHTGPNSVGF